MKKRIYTDTSVIGGCLDIEFKEGSNKIFAEFVAGRSILLNPWCILIDGNFNVVQWPAINLIYPLHNS